MATSATPRPEPATDTPPRPRRWNPLSVRMFVLMLVLIGAGSVLWIVVPAYRQDAAIHEIEKAGGFVQTAPGRIMWLRDWMSNRQKRATDEVTSISLRDEWHCRAF